MRKFNFFEIFSQDTNSLLTMSVKLYFQFIFSNALIPTYCWYSELSFYCLCYHICICCYNSQEFQGISLLNYSLLCRVRWIKYMEFNFFIKIPLLIIAFYCYNYVVILLVHNRTVSAQYLLILLLTNTQTNITFGCPLDLVDSRLNFSSWVHWLMIQLVRDKCTFLYFEMLGDDMPILSTVI